MENELIGICQNCNHNEATKLHGCPFAEEIHDDNTECNCCEECMTDCYGAI